MCEDFLFDNVSGFITDLGTIPVENVKLTLQRKYILCRKKYSQFWCDTATDTACLFKRGRCTWQVRFAKLAEITSLKFLCKGKERKKK